MTIVSCLLELINSVLGVQFLLHGETLERIMIGGLKVNPIFQKQEVLSWTDNAFYRIDTLLLIVLIALVVALLFQCTDLIQLNLLLIQLTDNIFWVQILLLLQLFRLFHLLQVQ